MEEKRVLALGFFDGVHIGHAGLLQMARRRADALGLKAYVLTFDRHPDELVFGTKVELINSRQDRIDIMTGLYHMDDVLFAHFDRAMMSMPWQDFIEDYLIGQLHAVHVVCGHDYHFGYRGQGNPQLLQQAFAERGLGCDIIDKIELDGITVSSTYIRRLLANGDVEAAKRFLGHPHRISGTVIHGNALGRTLGTPTANILMPEGTLTPKYGVYISRVHTPYGCFPAVTNIGCRPTVDGTHECIEPWILDFDHDLYDKTICVELCSYLREEKKFDSLDDLKAEIFRNAQQTRDYFAGNGAFEAAGAGI